MSSDLQLKKKYSGCNVQNWKGLGEAMVDVGSSVEKLLCPREVAVAWIGGVAADIQGSS